LNDEFNVLSPITGSAIHTDIPARLGRLPWSAWHWRVVIALGITWLLDGLEVTVVGSLGPALQRPETLGLIGRLVDTLDRKRIFLVTLAVRRSRGNRARDRAGSRPGGFAGVLL
jgi:hypothetical protein